VSAFISLPLIYPTIHQIRGLSFVNAYAVALQQSGELFTEPRFHSFDYALGDQVYVTLDLFNIG
jgi:hypothetical protein